ARPRRQRARRPAAPPRAGGRPGAGTRRVVIASGADTAWYVYGVVPADADPAVVANARGAAGASVQLVSAGALAAIVGRVPLDEFGEEPLRRNLERREWLEETVSAHDRVLAQALGTTPLVPLRF